MKKWIICLIAQVFAWTGVTIVDYIEETSANDFFDAYFICAAIVFFALYLAYREKIYGTALVRITSVLKMCGIWLVIDCFFGLLICILMFEADAWIIHQAAGGWENLLNGIEYPLFAIWNGCAVVVAVMLFEAIVSIVRYVKHKKGK